MHVTVTLSATVTLTGTVTMIGRTVAVTVTWTGTLTVSACVKGGRGRWAGRGGGRRGSWEIIGGLRAKESFDRRRFFGSKRGESFVLIPVLGGVQHRGRGGEE